MARDPYIEQRLINWAIWRGGKGAGGLGFASVNWAAFAAEDRFTTSEAVLPDGEEVLTDRAVLSLPTDHQDALEEQFIQTGTKAAKARRLGCHERTFHDRVDAGMRGVARWLTDRDQQLADERARVETLQRLAASGELPKSDTKRSPLGGEWLDEIRRRGG